MWSALFSIWRGRYLEELPKAAVHEGRVHCAIFHLAIFTCSYCVLAQSEADVAAAQACNFGWVVLLPRFQRKLCSFWVLFFLEELFKKDFWVLYPKFSDAAGISRCGQLLVGGAAVGARTSRGGWERGKSMEQIFAALLLLELWSTTVLSFPKRVSRLIFQALRPLLCLLPLPSICFVWSRSLGSFSTWVGKLS